MVGAKLLVTTSKHKAGASYELSVKAGEKFKVHGNTTGELWKVTSVETLQVGYIPSNLKVERRQSIKSTVKWRDWNVKDME